MEYMLQEAAEVSAWFSLTSPLLCSFKVGISGQCLEVLSLSLRCDTGLKAQRVFVPAEERRTYLLRPEGRFSECLQISWTVETGSKNLWKGIITPSPQRVGGIYVISRTTFSHVRVGQRGNRNKAAQKHKLSNSWCWSHRICYDSDRGSINQGSAAALTRSCLLARR